MREGDTLDVEATEMQRLARHPYILTFHGVVQRPNDTTTHIVTELASHGTLRDALVVLEEKGIATLSNDVFLAVAQQVIAK